jgi:hypothetical protein
MSSHPVFLNQKGLQSHLPMHLFSSAIIYLLNYQTFYSKLHYLFNLQFLNQALLEDKLVQQVSFLLLHFSVLGINHHLIYFFIANLAIC